SALVAEEDGKPPEIADDVERRCLSTEAEIPIWVERRAPIAAGQIALDRFTRGAAFDHGERDTEGEDRVVELMGITGAQPAIANEGIHGIRIVRDGANGFDLLAPSDAPAHSCSKREEKNNDATRILRRCGSRLWTWRIDSGGLLVDATGSARLFSRL